MSPTSYKDLIVWQRAIELAQEVYAVTDNFPREEIYGLTSQMKRAAVSIASNIAEGSRRNSRKEFAKFITHSFGSGAELETQRVIAGRLRFGKEVDFARMDALLDEVMRMLNGLFSGLRV